jgi:sortase A
MKKRQWNTYIALIFFLAGLGLIGNAAYIHAKALLAGYLLRTAWTETVEQGGRRKPWPWADTWPVAKLSVPEHAIDLVVLEGDTGNVLAFGPGHMALSSLPGQPGNSIISGHRDTSFKFLEKVERGDIIELQTLKGDTVKYRVSGIYITDEAVLDMNIESDTPLLTLVTCYPFDAVNPGGSQRYLVFAEYDNS